MASSLFRLPPHHARAVALSLLPRLFELEGMFRQDKQDPFFLTAWGRRGGRPYEVATRPMGKHARTNPHGQAKLVRGTLGVVDFEL